MNWLTKLHQYYGPCRLTLSGDVALMPARQHLRYELTGSQRQAVEDWIAALRRRYPFFSIEINDGISEAEIRFFTYQSNCAERHILSVFCQALRELATIFHGDRTVSVIMNFSGIVYDGATATHFRILNKEDAVQYTITRMEQRSLYERVSHSAYLRMILTAVLIVLLAVYIGDNVSSVTEPVGRLV
ncbi:MAG: hypothetical protein LKF47_04860 [Megasphaera sp.]|jgi:hypothetical protein|nr:hypothetical protein [Megasphaera sp.]MCI1247708.1 hypothetical protein [Megasphaera sp.]